MWSTGVPRTYDVSREGPFDAYCSPMDTGDSPLVATGLPGCLYRITSYTGPAVAHSKPAYGMQLHHTRFLEFIGAPESARLLYRSPAFWVQRMGEEDAVGMGRVVFPSQEVVALSPTPLAPRAAQYMAAMGLWHPQMGPGGSRACSGFILQ